MTSLAERVAHLALSQFDSLPQKCKPRSSADGEREWTPMSAVVLIQHPIDGPEILTCVSLATGTKCLPASALTKCNGQVLHDSHAEVLALRGLNYWLLAEVKTMLESTSYESQHLEVCRHDPLQSDPNCTVGAHVPIYRLKETVSIHLFTTEAPCGDASMEILIKSFPDEAATPWPVDDSTSPTTLRGRGHFSLLGHVRRKPARADAESSLSKSCSDKLALKQFTSVISFPADLFIRQTPNAFLKSIVVYEDQYDSNGYQRAFGMSGRLARLSDTGSFFSAESLPSDFPSFAFAKPQATLADVQPAKPKVSNISALWVRSSGSMKADTLEVLINGVKQGYKQWDQRPNKASVVSRRSLWTMGRVVSKLLLNTHASPTEMDGVAQPGALDRAGLVQRALSTSTYLEAKSSSLRNAFIERKAKVTAAMGNWGKSGDDHNWSYE